MNEAQIIVFRGISVRTVRKVDGTILPVPADWALLPPGDAGLTRRVKAAGPAWTVQERKGRKVFSRGVWAPKVNIDAARAQLEAERATEGYARRKEAGAKRRERKQEEYVGSFFDAVVTFLAFAPQHEQLARQVAQAVTRHATPVGSGTVARTQRIPIEQRVESAVIAWMRHQTTGYEGMAIPRVKGKRREIRRMLAERSRMLLMKYRQGVVIDPAKCLLRKAVGGGGGMEEVEG